MCFDEVRQAERLSRILFCINLENEMAINKTYEELVESANKSVYGGGYLLNPSAADSLAEAEAEKRRRRGWNCADGVTIELSARERKLCGID